MTPNLFAAFAPPIRPISPLRRAITAAYRRDEAACLADLLPQATLPADMRHQIHATASGLVDGLRAASRTGGVEGLVQEYSLSSDEGVALMCLAEALLRIPDDATRDALIRDKIADGDWGAYLGGGRSLFVNAATWGLVVTGKLVGSVDDTGLTSALTRLVARAGEPVIRKGIHLAMRLMGEQFVTGETIDEALSRARRLERKGFRYSYDMLGEAAATAADAERYFREYEAAIHAIGTAACGRGVVDGPGISIKLSALHPRYSRAQADRVMEELLPRVRALAILAKTYDIGFNIDAEEMDRLELSLDLLESLALDTGLTDWDGLGFVVQGYGKRCPLVIDWIIDLARRAKRRIMVRLVKGAYWDAEIKRAQVDGLEDFPVYTRKVHTDVAYIACARKLLSAPDAVFPQFATHNAQTLATIYHLAGHGFEAGQYEFQCLHGMGEPLYEQVVGTDGLSRPCRIYAPVGTHETLLAYLVRRLLENGANSSFVNRIADPGVSVESLVADPVDTVRHMPIPGAPHDKINLPRALYADRRNSRGLDLSSEIDLETLSEALQTSVQIDWEAAPTFGDGKARAILNPADHRDQVGVVKEADPNMATIAASRAAASHWPRMTIQARAATLEKAADAIEARMPVLMGLIIREAGKSASNAISEVREAVDFLRYYAAQIRAQFGPEQKPLGPIACISPWNFPLAIFVGQVAAALAAGNPVLAKPAEETPLIAAEAVRLFHEAGVPRDALQLMTGDGSVGSALVEAEQTCGVMFTGSTEVARIIHAKLAKRLLPDGRPVPLIAETGGQNAMIVDSSALAEQVVADVISSAFDSAGQRCSALRILCLQEEVADRTLTMLRGALDELTIGRPDALCVDIGPVISATAQDGLNRHIRQMRNKGAKVLQSPLPEETRFGTFVPPTIIEIDDVEALSQEVFGPVLHVIRYKREDLDTLIDQINATGYGLTFGLHTRLDGTVRHVTGRINAGNLYVNRNTIGAIVGVQPFGGRGLSGTGPKAGGPLYLRRLVSNAPAFALATPIANPPLAEFIDWLTLRGDTDLARRARAYASQSPVGSTMELPGPVGERNLYALHPRGTVLLMADTMPGLLEQMAVVLATGNTAVIEGMPLPHDLPPDVASRFEPYADQAFSVALIQRDLSKTTASCLRLAAKAGPIIPVHAPLANGDIAYDCAMLLEEVSTSINTTAAGGNASLMMIG